MGCWTSGSAAKTTHLKPGGSCIVARSFLGGHGGAFFGVERGGKIGGKGETTEGTEEQRGEERGAGHGARDLWRVTHGHLR
jgi:hypothetical protein